MSAGTVTQAALWVGAFDCSPFTGAVAESPGSVTVREANNFGAAGFVQLSAGIKRGTWRLSGQADHSASGISTAFPSSAPGTQYAVSMSTPGTAAGDFALLGRGLVGRSMFGAPIDEVGQFELELASDTVFTRGYLAAPMASRTTSGLTGTAVALTGPTASQSLYAALHVSAAAGTNLVVTIESDDNSGFTSPTTRITFSTVSATGWQWSSVAGNLSTETYWRAKATIASGTFTFGVTFGVT